MKTKNRVKSKTGMIHSGDEILFETHAYEKEIYLCSYYDDGQREWKHVFLNSLGIHVRPTLKGMLQVGPVNIDDSQINIYDEIQEEQWESQAETKASVANANSLMF